MKTNKTLLLAEFLIIACLCFAGALQSQEVAGKHQPPMLIKPGTAIHKNAGKHFANFPSLVDVINQSAGKSHAASQIHVDSITRYSISNGNDKSYSSYDQNCNLLSKVKKVWVIDSWVNNAITECTYDISGHMLTSTNGEWMGTGWEYNQRIVNTFDAVGNCATTTGQFWDGTGWINTGMSTYSCDDNGNVLTELYQDWDGASWMNSSLDSSSYDPAGNRLQILSHMWDGDAWMCNAMEVLTYDADGNRLTDMFAYWDWDLMEWTNNFMTTNTYDENGNCLTYLEQMWDGAAWGNWFRVTFTYDANGNELTYINENCYDGYTWEYYSKGLFTYDAGNNMLSCLYQMFKSGISDWENDYKVDYDYQWNNVTADALTWTGTDWMMGDCYFNVYLADNGERLIFWAGDGGAVRVSAYYSSGGVGIGEALPQAAIRVYPNPASDKLTIELNNSIKQKVSVTLSDITGTRVATLFDGILQPGTQSLEANIHHLKAGIYFLQCSTPAGSTRQKICVVR
jgi:hypothetical protein